MLLVYIQGLIFISGLNQLINHSDKLAIMSGNQFKPNIIFRVGYAKIPIDAGPQHTNNYSCQISKMLTSIKVYELKKDANPAIIFDKIIKNGGINL